MERAFNIYCDESRVENRDSRHMVIGALFVPREKKNKIKNELTHLFDDCGFNYELKWSGVGRKKLDAYKKIIDYFVTAPDLQFRCIVVDKQKVQYELYHDNDEEVAFFKFYYFMLRAKLLSGFRYYIFLDKKPTREKRRAGLLYAFLQTYIKYHKSDCCICHLQSYDSRGNIFIQMADFLTGIAGYGCNNDTSGGDSVKAEVVNFIQGKLNKKRLCDSTPLGEEKFNVFVWRQ